MAVASFRPIEQLMDALDSVIKTKSTAALERWMHSVTSTPDARAEAPACSDDGDRCCSEQHSESTSTASLGPTEQLMRALYSAIETKSTAALERWIHSVPSTPDARAEVPAGSDDDDRCCSEQQVESTGIGWLSPSNDRETLRVEVRAHVASLKELNKTRGIRTFASRKRPAEPPSRVAEPAFVDDVDEESPVPIDEHPVKKRRFGGALQMKRDVYKAKAAAKASSKAATAQKPKSKATKAREAEKARKKQAVEASLETEKRRKNAFAAMSNTHANCEPIHHSTGPKSKGDYYFTNGVCQCCAQKFIEVRSQSAVVDVQCPKCKMASIRGSKWIRSLKCGVCNEFHELPLGTISKCPVSNISVNVDDRFGITPNDPVASCRWKSKAR